MRLEADHIILWNAEIEVGEERRWIGERDVSIEAFQLLRNKFVYVKLA